MAERLPRILQDTIDRNPDYPASVSDRFRRLGDEIAGDAPLRAPERPAPDYDLWQRRFAPHAGETWLGTEWFFSETLAYRLALQAGRYWTTRRDPFRPFKDEELASDAMWDALDSVLGAAASDGTVRERLHAHLTGALWGNRMDQTIQASMAQGTEAAGEHLLADDRSAATEHLLTAEAPGAVHVLMDNAGTEEALDLATAHFLLDEDLAREVVLHVKMQPVLVSDATGRDVLAMLEAMAERGGRPEALAERLNGHLQTGRLRLAPDFFWSTAGRLWELPPRLHESLADAQLVIGKGDVNYRRATHDAVWPAGATLAEATGEGFPAPLLSLRTIKSDTLVGVDPGTTERLDAKHGEDNWRTTGTYAVAQFAS
jgi:hypothetical protein